ncbi:hypothetical protein MPC4_110151 [Methylocella tundrae]|uniref:Uncharacterized protein n=1 Tax=Methylocella tundrae TaxID=227605 RepID=A0A8B6M1E5_METTU|nr:hypothetical protein MPC4_110151 [Methylocella tundrae]
MCVRHSARCPDARHKGLLAVEEVPRVLKLVKIFFSPCPEFLKWGHLKVCSPNLVNSDNGRTSSLILGTK